jgi:hypothetical protein
MNKKKKLPWTSDPREIEKRMIECGFLKGGLIWDKSDLKVKKKS